MRIELSVPQDFLDILSVIGGIFYGDITHREIFSICTDSRECQYGDMFFALNGARFDGNDFIGDAIKRGATPIGNKIKAYGIKVKSPNSAFLNFAKYYKTRLPQLKYTIAITGSVGKTTTKEFLKILSSERYKTHATWENFNNEIGLPLTIFSAPKDTEVMVCEMGMNHSGEIAKLSNTAEPDIAVITKLGTAHIGNLGSIEDIAKAKLEVISGLRGSLIIPYGEVLLQDAYENTKTHSSNSRKANTAILKNTFGKHEIYHENELLSFMNFPMVGEHTRECLAAAVACAFEMNLNINEIISGINKIDSKAARYKMISTSLGFDILDDSYNASYESVIASLSMLHEMKSYKQKSILFGDILELGPQSRSIHRKIGTKIAEGNISNIFLLGSFADAVAEGAIEAGFSKSRIHINRDISAPEITSALICNKMRSGELLFVKASHKINLSRVIDLILGKRK